MAAASRSPPTRQPPTLLTTRHPVGSVLCGGDDDRVHTGAVRWVLGSVSMVNNIKFGTDLVRHVVEGMRVEESCDDLDACYHNQACRIDKKDSYRVPLLNSI
jgi:hypothetical protein